VHETRDAALARVFGAGARFAPRTVYLTPAQIDAAASLARAKIEPPRFTYWVATRGDSLLGWAFLDSRIVRTMPATFFVAVRPDGKLLRADVLAFQEPEDYLPPRRWLDRLAGCALSPRLRPGDAVDGITGATLSARATTETIRRCLALVQVLEPQTIQGEPAAPAAQHH